MAEFKENPKRVDMSELEILLDIDEVNDYIYDAVERAKEKYYHKIEELKKVQKGSETGRASLQDGWARDKTYFFEFNRVRNQGKMTGFQWKLSKFKLGDREDIVRMVFPDQFVLTIDQAQVAGQKIQNERIDSLASKRSFQLDFMKPSEDRVVGFVKEVGMESEEYLKDKNKLDMRKMNGLDKELMYQKMHRLMEEMDDVRLDVFCYLIMVEENKKKELSGKSGD